LKRVLSRDGRRNASAERSFELACKRNTGWLLVFARFGPRPVDRVREVALVGDFVFFRPKRNELDVEILRRQTGECQIINLLGRKFR
jgi:hypothetical protein